MFLIKLIVIRDFFKSNSMSMPYNILELILVKKSAPLCLTHKGAL